MKRALFPVIIARPMKPCGDGTGTWRRRMSTLGHLPRDTFILLLIIARLTTAACADDLPATPRTPTPQPPLHEDSVENPDMPGMDLAVLSSVMQASLAFLQPRTLESHAIHDFALWGLNGLSALDPSLSIDEQHGFLQLAATQKTVLALPVPPPDDVAGWSAAITRILDVAWRHSPTMRNTGQDGVLQGFFDELFNHLDPYSRYVPPGAAVSDRSTRTGGEATAGLTLGLDHHTIKITAVNANGPAWPTSLAAGQIVRAVNGRSTESRTVDTVTSWLNGPAGSLVRITVEAKGRQTTVTLHRASTPPETVFAYTSGKHVVLHITAFSANTAEEMSQYLDEAMNVPGIAGLILDLRGNRGGVLQQAVTTSALMLDHGVAAITQGRDPQANHVWAVQGGDMTNGLPIIVLVDGRTASAAEILAAALSDQKRGVVIGSATLGKGLVQTIGQMPNGAELFVTWSRVLAPLGWPLQGLGVMPQVCTSRGESELERQLQNLAEGTADSAQWVMAARQVRSPADLSHILAIRKACPAAIGTDSDLDAAHSLLDNPEEYRAALSAIPEEDTAPPNGG